MSIKFRIVSQKDDFVEYLSDSSKHIIHYSDLQPYWTYANTDEQEGVSIRLQDNLLVCIMLTASTQGGIIFVWDCKQHKLLHISDGSYTYAALVHDDSVYGLRVVSNFVTPAHFVLSKSAFGTMDAYTDAEIVNCKFTCDVDAFDGDFDHIGLLHNQGQFIMDVNSNKYVINMNEAES